jgi:hypothetical protein
MPPIKEIHSNKTIDLICLTSKKTFNLTQLTYGHFQTKEAPFLIEFLSTNLLSFKDDSTNRNKEHAGWFELTLKLPDKYGLIDTFNLSAF